MKINLGNLSFCEETSEKLAFLKPFEADILNWIGESDENRMKYVTDPMSVLRRFIKDEAVMGKVLDLAEEVRKMYPGFPAEKPVVLNPAVGDDNNYTVPGGDYTQGWDMVASARVSDFNSLLDKVGKELNEKLNGPAKVTYNEESDQGKRYIEMYLGMFHVSDGASGTEIHLDVPVISGTYIYGDESYNLAGAFVKLTVNLEKVYLGETTEDTIRGERYKYNLTLSEGFVNDMDLVDPTNKPICTGKAGAYIPTALWNALEPLGKMIGKIPVYSVTVTDENKQNLIKEYKFLFPEQCQFAGAYNADPAKSVLSILCQTIENMGTLCTDAKSLPEGADISLNISNNIFFKYILMDGLCKGFEAYAPGIDSSWFDVDKTDGVTVGIKSNSKFKATIPIDNCPDVDVTSLSFRVDGYEQYWLNLSISTTAAHFFDIDGTVTAHFKFNIAEGDDGTQTIQLQMQGDPEIDLDSDFGWASWLLTVITFGIAGVILGIINAVINGKLDSLDLSGLINTDDLLNGKLQWSFVDVGKLVCVNPMACFQIGFAKA